MRSTSRFAAVSPVLVGLGMALIAAGFIWQLTSKPENWLSEEAAQRYVDAAEALHGSTMDPGHNAEDVRAEDLPAYAEYSAASAAVESARSRQLWAPRIVQGVGAVFAVIGLVGMRSRS